MSLGVKRPDWTGLLNTNFKRGNGQRMTCRSAISWSNPFIILDVSTSVPNLSIGYNTRCLKLQWMLEIVSAQSEMSLRWYLPSLILKYKINSITSTYQFVIWVLGWRGNIQYPIWLGTTGTVFQIWKPLDSSTLGGNTLGKKSHKFRIYVQICISTPESFKKFWATTDPYTKGSLAECEWFGHVPPNRSLWCLQGPDNLQIVPWCQ